MGSGAAAGSSNVSDHLILFDPLPDLHGETGQVTKPCRQAVTVFDDNEVAVSGFPLRIDDLAVGRGTDLGAEQGGDIHTQVNLSLSIERISPITVMAGENSLNRPYCWCSPANRSLLLRHLLQQHQLIFHLRRSVPKRIDTVLQVRGAQQLGGGVVDFRTADSRYIDLAAFVQAVTFAKSLDLLEKILDVVYFLAELDGGHFEVLLLNLKVGVFCLKFLVVGRLEGHLDVAESKTDRHEKAEQANGSEDMKDARGQLQLPQPRTSVRHNNKGIKALGHSAYSTRVIERAKVPLSVR